MKRNAFVLIDRVVDENGFILATWIVPIPCAANEKNQTVSRNVPCNQDNAQCSYLKIYLEISPVGHMTGASKYEKKFNEKSAAKSYQKFNNKLYDQNVRAHLIQKYKATQKYDQTKETENSGRERMNHQHHSHDIHPFNFNFNFN